MFTREILQEAGQAGAKEVSLAFGKLSGKKVEVTTSVVEVVSYEFVTDSLKEGDGQSIITYAQVIEGVPGAAILSISREDTLVLVDLLNDKEVGTTGILMDLDRSAVKETLNILSNSYLNALSKATGKKLIISAPNLMPASHVDEIFKRLRKKNTDANDQILLFKTTLSITEFKIGAELLIIFDEDLAEEINDIK